MPYLPQSARQVHPPTCTAPSQRFATLPPRFGERSVHLLVPHVFRAFSLNGADIRLRIDDDVAAWQQSQESMNEHQPLHAGRNIARLWCAAVPIALPFPPADFQKTASWLRYVLCPSPFSWKLCTNQAHAGICLSPDMIHSLTARFAYPWCHQDSTEALCSILCFPTLCCQVVPCCLKQSLFTQRRVLTSPS